MKYQDIYSFEVIGELMDGKTVYALDRKNGAVYNLDSEDVTAAGLILVLQEAKGDTTNRYLFWVENAEVKEGE